MLLLMIVIMNIDYGISSNGITVYYVIPDMASSPCPKNQSCNTLDTYIKNSSFYFKSNTTFLFYPGNHVLNEENLTIIQNCENVQFIGIGNVTQHFISDVVIFTAELPMDNDCWRAYNYPEDNQIFHQSSSVINCSVPSGFAFINVTNLTIINITIYGCGAPVPSTEYTKIDQINNFTASLLIINGHDLKVEGLSIQMGIGYGLLGVNIQGQPHIMDSSFINNNVRPIVYGSCKFVSSCFYYNPCIHNGFEDGLVRFMLIYANAWKDYNFVPGGNALLLYTDMTSDSNKNDVSLEIGNSFFALGLDASLIYIPGTYYPMLTSPCYQYGTGLTISAHQITYDLYVNVSDSIAYRNQASCGANFYFNDYSGRSHFTITNTSSIRGTCLNGCGLFYNLQNTEQSGNYTPSLLVADSTFETNFAFYNGSSLYTLINVSLTSQQNRLTPNISIIRSNFINDRAVTNNIMKLYQSMNTNQVQITFQNVIFASTFCTDGIDTNISLLVSNCSFQGLNRAITVQNNTLYIHDCIFGNTLSDQGPLIQSGIAAVFSMIYFMGHNIFINNNPMYGKGGALELYFSTFQISAPNSVTFINNTASLYGGAIYSSSDSVSTQVRCFFQINDSNGTLLIPNTFMYFDGNSAGYAGSAIYGGSIDDCWLDCDLIPNYNCSSHTSGVIFNNISKFINMNTSTSLISSDPFQLCPCENGQPNCEQDYVPKRIDSYPGQMANISLALVGQRNGFSPGTVVMLKPIYTSQVIATKCANFTMQLQGIDDHTFINSYASLYSYSAFLNGIINMKTWTVFLQLCPFGFLFNYTTLYCDCDPEIKRYNITCDLNLLVVHRPSQTWIGNVTNTTLSVYTYCPFDYCKPIDMNLDLMNQDEQCNYNRSSVLCGQCKTNLSMVFGSSSCEECSDNTLWLIVLFAALGIGLIAILFFFNLTVSSGTINGLIIYANIIKLNETTFLNTNDEKAHVQFCKIFISWLNLDFGIKTCFYNGLNNYVKTWLRLVFPLYLLCLISIIVIVSRYSRTVSKLCRFNAVPVLATLIWLIYSSLSRTAVTIFQYAALDNSKLLWLYDGNLEYFSREHAALFVVGLLIMIFLTPYTILLAFLPFFQAKSHLRLFSWVNKMKPLLDSYQAPYKDSYRYWTGVILLARFVLYLVIAFNKNNDYKINLTTVILVSIVFLLATSVLSVYKYWPLCLLDAFFYMNIAVLSFITFSNNSPSPNSIVNIVGILSAFVCFICILIINLWKMHKMSIKNILCKAHCIKHQDMEPLIHAKDDQLQRGITEMDENEVFLYREPLTN